MKYNELVTKRQARPVRAGRGISAGRGKTAGRGTKGQGARKSGVKKGFEGGQMPLYMRLPKLRGFKSHRQPAEIVYTAQLEEIKKQNVDNSVLFEAGLITDMHSRVKLIIGGELKTKKDVRLQSASKGAVAAVEKAGGTFQPVARVPRAKKPAKTDEK